jgi:uncharacterized protein YndB with AHSA1/START domain
MAIPSDTSTRPQSAPRTLQVRRVFNASPERLFAAWTTPKELMRWHAPSPLSVLVAEVDLRPGGRYRIEMAEPNGGAVHKVSGTYRVVDAPKRLAYSWQWEGDPTETHVTLEFNVVKGGTEIVLTHEGFTSDESRGSHEHGWTGIMERFAEYVPNAV